MTFLLLAILLTASCDQTKNSPKPGSPTPSTPDPPALQPVDLTKIPREAIAFPPESVDRVDFTPQVPPYDLPMSTAKISNFADVTAKMPLGGSAVSLLQKNGFAVLRTTVGTGGEDITQPYLALRELNVPIFVTADSLLHLYHIQFDETLRQIEEREFYDRIWDVSKSLLSASVTQHNGFSGDLKEAAKRNAAFFAIGLSLLQPREDQLCKDKEDCENPGVAAGAFKKGDLAKYAFAFPEFVKDKVSAELGFIQKHAGFAPSPLFLYEEDYSQYVPRGHYTRSEKLKNYFLALMWYGRISMLLKGTDEVQPGGTCPFCKALISIYDAKIQTMQAALIAAQFAGSTELMEKWNRIYSVTAFYVGFSDDLGPLEYLGAMGTVFGATFDPATFDQEQIDRLKVELAQLQGPKIYGGTGKCTILLLPNEPLEAGVKKAEECLASTKGMRLMGQRFIPDSYMMSEIVAPYSERFTGSGEPFTYVQIPGFGPVRGFPRGLDVMALLGSKRAKELLVELGDTSYLKYEEVFKRLASEFAALTSEDWNKNLYWAWLYSLKALIADFGGGLPTFMQTQAWHEKELTTALASWAQLRHDTILYAKQSYTGAIEVCACEPSPPPRVVGYVEPLPEFYNRLLTLARMTRKGLSSMNVLDEPSKQRLSSLETLLERLVGISKKELENTELSDQDYDFINDFGDALNAVINDVDEKAKKTTIVADVHTDINTEKVLEEGTGYVRLIVVAYKVPDGRILMGAGPVLSYYEFKQDMSDRLTDEKWREMLSTRPPVDPEWVAHFTE